jgi:hypothetical protein
MVQIKANAIYTDPTAKPHSASDPPEGCVFVERYHSGGRQYEAGRPWSTLAIGQVVEVETTDHYLWTCTVECIVREGDVPVAEANAWARHPGAGIMLLVEDASYKVYLRCWSLRPSRESDET